MRNVCLIAMLSLCFFMFPSAVHAEEEEKQDMQQLLNRIEELEKQLNRIEDENKARKRLEVTDEEKAQQEKEILDAVSRDYTFDPKRTLGIDYGLSYELSRSEEISTSPLEVKRNTDHTITHSISANYAILDNLSGSLSLPIVYKYDKLGTEEKMDQTDIGDISLGVGWQPVKRKAGEIRTSLSLGIGLPTGRSPYEINPETELSTGNGAYSVSLGANFSKQVDPVVVFWSFGYGHFFEVNDINHIVTINSTELTLLNVKRGDSISASGGLAYALSYVTSINISFGYNYTKGSVFDYKELASKYKSADSASGTFGIGMGWRVSQKTTLSFSLSYNLTDPTFSFSFRAPFSFVL